MILKVDKDKPSKDIIKNAVGVLRSGGVLVAPTETCYGLVCDATNGEAMEKIFKIKERDRGKWLPMVVASYQQLRQYFELNDKEKELAEKYPGLSIVLAPRLGAQKRDGWLLPGQETCAVRISANNLMRVLAKKLARPLVATSANMAGGENCYTAECVSKSFKAPFGAHKDTSPKGGLKFVDLILDGGELKKKKPSTIVRVVGETLEVVRQGEIVVE